MLRDVASQKERSLAEINELREAVQGERAALDEEKARISKAMPAAEELVKLNVGGTRYETSIQTLRRVEDSMLDRMFGRNDIMLQRNPEDGSVFIDGDGERFGMILDFLRRLGICSKSSNFGDLAERMEKMEETKRQAMLADLDDAGDEETES